MSQSNQNKTIYYHTNRTKIFIEKQQKLLSAKNLESFLKYNDEMIIHGISESTRYRNLNHFVLLAKILQKDLVNVTEDDLRKIVAKITIKYGENGKQSNEEKKLFLICRNNVDAMNVCLKFRSVNDSI